MENRIKIIQDILTKNNMIKGCKCCGFNWMPFGGFEDECPKCGKDIELDSEMNEVLEEVNYE